MMLIALIVFLTTPDPKPMEITPLFFYIMSGIIGMIMVFFGFFIQFWVNQTLTAKKAKDDERDVSIEELEDKRIEIEKREIEAKARFEAFREARLENDRRLDTTLKNIMDKLEALSSKINKITSDMRLVKKELNIND